jgi:phenylalanyl-tRNA synthetase beta chain
MRIPLSWIREYAAILETTTAEEIGTALVSVGFEVEEIEYHGKDISGPLVVGRVLKIEEITEFKKPMRWVELDCGESLTRFVICGASNFTVNDLVVVALPGAVLPGDFAISQRETYGKVSNGMICSSRELGLGEDHSGILVLPANSAVLGCDAITLLEINDVIFDIAVNPDRGYALSLRGMAREVAISLGVEFTDPVYSIKTETFTTTGKGVVPKIDDATGVSVIYIRTLDCFDPKAQSPLWMRRRIEKCGMRSISLAVDVTNYVMLELGQPIHAFDRAQIEGFLHVRRAGKTKTFTTLDGQERALSAEDLLVADDVRALALAGTMGGANSEVGASTTSLAIEAARFDPISIAKNARRHKLSTEASRRFERGVDPSLAEYASARAASLLIVHGGAKHVDSQCDGEPRYSPIVELDPHFIATLTGADISLTQVREKLALVGCDIEEKGDSLWRVDPPSWRNDLLTQADLVEEVARLVGYDAIPSLLPPHPLSPGLTDFQRRLRILAQLLADRGLVEVQNYPFISETTLKEMGYKGERASAFRIANPMSEDAPLLRTHLIPGLIDTAARNISRGARDFGLFEIGTIFRNVAPLAAMENPPTDRRPSQKIIDQIYAGVPSQPIHVGGILIGNAQSDDWRGKGRPYDWNDAIEFAESILLACNVPWMIERSDFAPWHPGRCAELLVNGKAIAHAGELHPRVVAAFGLPERSCAFVVNLSGIPEHEVLTAPAVGTMPVAVQDIALIVDEAVTSAEVVQALKSGAGEMLESVILFDRYDKIGEGKISLAYTLTFRAPDRTLTGSEIAKMREAAVEVARIKLGATLRSA